MGKHKVLFGNSEKNREIGTVDNKGEAIGLVNNFLKEHNYYSPYFRMWNQNGKTIFDVGSHTEFFYIVPEIEIQ